MTYCLAIKLNAGLIFAGDSRTNAGVDRVATYRKLFTFGNGNTHALTLLCSGNLATTQALVEAVNRSCRETQGLFSDRSLFDAAQRVGKMLVDIIARWSEPAVNKGVDFSCNIILGGQIAGEQPRLFYIYPQGNFIETSPETPFLQLGEEKYGKPILDRIVRPDTPIEKAVICALLSLDSTMKSNMTVDMPLDVLVYARDSFDLSRVRRIERHDPEFSAMSRYWGDNLKRLVDEMANFKI